MNKQRRVGKLLDAQKWVELHGNFSPQELRMLADRIDKNYKKVNGNKNRYIN